MFDEFKNEQAIAYQIIKNALDNNKLSHAYLIETNGYEKKNEFVKAFAKAIICPKKITSDSNCSECNICKQIDKDEFVELETINPVGSVIKKEQLNKLQINFSVKPIIGDKKVYIINDADRMNQVSSNSILKFLEEPNEGIFAILVTSSVDKIIETIVSRCQIISLKNNFVSYDLSCILTKMMSDEKKIEYEKLTVEEKENINEKFINFINKVEFDGSSAICFEKSVLELLKNKDDVEMFFNLALLYYREILDFYLNHDLKIFPGKYKENINKISEFNSKEEICLKLNKIINLKSNIIVNANTNLLIDRFVLSLLR